MAYASAPLRCAESGASSAVSIRCVPVVKTCVSVLLSEMSSWCRLFCSSCTLTRYLRQEEATETGSFCSLFLCVSSLECVLVATSL